MPNPLSRVKADALVVIGNAGHRALSKRPPLAILAMEAIASYSNVESFLLRLFVRMFGGNEALAARVYLAMEIQTAKSQALTAALDNLGNDDHARLVKAVMKLARTNQKIRNDLAHHTWGYSPDLPDALLLLDPKHTVGNELSADNVQVYTAKEFNAIIATNDRICGYGLKLTFILDEHPGNADGALYDELCREPAIQEKLNRPA